jgi:hypothetical protein
MMPKGHFQNGAFVEDTATTDELATAAFQATAAFYDRWNSEHPPNRVVWVQSNTGFLIACTPDPKYAEQLKKFIGTLK